MATPTLSSRIRFGVFEADLRAGELRKQGIKIKLHEQPFKVLAVLLEHPGELITRQELGQRLWPANTFVDSEVGLNSAVMKLRDALGDSAENPRFIETLPRRGYRFIVPVEHLISVPDPHQPDALAKHFRTGNAASPDGQPRESLETSAIGDVADASDQQRSARCPTAQSVRHGAGTSARSRVGVAICILFVIAFGVWWRVRSIPTHQYTIAVLPLQNLSPEPGRDYFSDGLTDEIISNLSVIDGLEVKSRTSSFTFKDNPSQIRTVGAQLGAKLVLEGSVLRAGNKLRVNVQLIRVADDVPLWSGRYDRELKDIFEVQDEISRSIVNELRLNLGRGQRRYNTNLEAYDSYLRASSLVNRAPGVDSEKIAMSIPLFEAAIAKDPHFAPAYAGIADAYAYLSATPRTFSPELAYPKMQMACEKALQLDPLLPQANSCMGLVYSRERNWVEAERSFGRAFQLNTSLSRPREDFALWVLLPLGRVDEAIQELRTAVKLDPLSVEVVNSLDYALIIGSHYNEVLDDYRSVVASDPDNYFARQHWARVLVQRGNLNEGIGSLEKLGVGSEGFLGYAYAKAGRPREAELIAVQHPDMPWLQALVYAGLGDKDKSIEALRKMGAINDPRAGVYPLFPEFALLRGDPRLNDLRKTLGLPEFQ